MKRASNVTVWSGSLLGVVLVLSLATSWAAPACGADMRRYTIEACVVEYELSGMQTGSVTLAFDRWGMREARETRSETRVLNTAVKNSNLVLLDGDFTYTIDLNNRTGTKMPTPLLPQLRERLEREGKNLSELGKEMMVQMGGVKVADEKFLNKPCEVWELKATGTRMWLWQGVPLKTTANLLGQTLNTVAVRVDETPKLTEDRFAVPAGVTITEGVSPLDQLRNLKSKTRPGVRLPK